MFALSGSSISLKRSRVFSLSSGGFAVAGQDIGYFYLHRMSAQSARYRLESDGMSLHIGPGKYIIAGAAAHALTGWPVTFGVTLSKRALLVREPPSFGTLFQSLTLTGEIVADPGGQEQLFKPGW